MLRLARSAAVPMAVLLMVVGLGSGLAGAKLGQLYERNRMCCGLPKWRNLQVSIREAIGLTRFHSQIGQDKWILESVFPEIEDGYFLDVGSGDGTVDSNTKALESRGWRGICIDPFPSHMEDRTCQMLKEVVFSEAGKLVTFQASGELGGITETLGAWKDRALEARAVEFTTTTLRDILERSNAPRFIHFVSLDIEGAELEALKAFPFETHRIGALAVEHNYEEPKRSAILALLKRHGYRRTHSWQQDDFYLPERRR